MLREDFDEFIKTIPSNVRVICATKYVESSQMKILLEKGINDFGENRVESFLEKYEELNNENINWHFIGHLQRNKAKKVISKISCLHSLDSLELAKIIETSRNSPLDTFIEVSINHEENKDGVFFENIIPFVQEILKFQNINLIGFMMMAKKDSTHEELISQFSKLKEVEEKVNKELNLNLKMLSMGMSSDYKEAIECGATHIRLGRILWKM